jgi:hypothetical protein
VPERVPALTPLWVEERTATSHAMAGKGRFIDVNELEDETLEKLATAEYVPAHGTFYIARPGQRWFNPPDDLSNERPAS